MAEYLAPGVYVEEYDSMPTPIPGVSTSIDDATAQLLVDSVKRIAKVPVDWPGFSHSDPGITLIRLCAWLAESLVSRADGGSEARRDALNAFAPLLTVACASSDAPLVRPRFFTGRLLDAATLAAEQDYQREKLRRHNRALHGFGIVSGLAVHIGLGGDEKRVIVEPGYAIDSCGDEMAIGERAMLRLPINAADAFVSLRRWDHLRDPVPGPNGPEATSIEEASILAISARLPATAVALARLVREQAGWSIDANFAAPSAVRAAGDDP